MNWYSEMRKYAFPYGRLHCSKCKTYFFCDYGFKDASQGGTSTQNVDEQPFVDHEIVKYDEPQPDYDKTVTQDEKERGTIVVQCPKQTCGQWMRVEYELNTEKLRPEQRSDFFSQVKPLETDPILQEEAEAYMSVGMTKGMGFTD